MGVFEEKMQEMCIVETQCGAEIWTKIKEHHEEEKKKHAPKCDVEKYPELADADQCMQRHADCKKCEHTFIEEQGCAPKNDKEHDQPPRAMHRMLKYGFKSLLSRMLQNHDKLPEKCRDPEFRKEVEEHCKDTGCAGTLKPTPPNPCDDENEH